MASSCIRQHYLDNNIHISPHNFPDTFHAPPPSVGDKNVGIQGVSTLYIWKLEIEGNPTIPKSSRFLFFSFILMMFMTYDNDEDYNDSKYKIPIDIY